MGVTLSALNRPDELSAVLTYALGNGADVSPPPPRASPEKLSTEEQLYIVRRMREGLLKSAAIVGVPKVWERSRVSLRSRSSVLLTVARSSMQFWL